MVDHTLILISLSACLQKTIVAVPARVSFKSSLEVAVVCSSRKGDGQACFKQQE